MPLIQPDDLREKQLIIGGGGAGKTTIWLSIARWAFLSGDTRKFMVMDTDDEAVLHVMNEPMYAGMLAEDGGNVHITSVVEWPDYEEFSKNAVANTVKGDFIILDFISHAWPAVQEGFLQDSAKKTRGQALYQAGVEGLIGWDMYKEEFNWNAINGAYFDFLKPILLRSRAHVIMTAEEEEIFGKKLTSDQTEHVAQFGKWKAVGQKKLPYQCRSYIRVQRLARGRVLHTLKDRAREEMNGDTMEPDFFKMYMVGRAGWSITDGG